MSVLFRAEGGGARPVPALNVQEKLPFVNQRAGPQGTDVASLRSVALEVVGQTWHVSRCDAIDQENWDLIRKHASYYR